MKYLFLSILMIGVGIGVVGCEDDDKDDPPEEEVEEETENDARMFSFNGKIDAVEIDDTPNYIKYNDMEDNFIISADRGVDYDPQNSLPDNYRVTGIEVWVYAEDLERTSHLGRVIRVDRIRRR